MESNCDIFKMMINAHATCSTSPFISIPKLLPFKLSYLNFHQLEVMSRQHDSQLQVGENYSYQNSLIWDQKMQMLKQTF